MKTAFGICECMDLRVAPFVRATTPVSAPPCQPEAERCALCVSGRLGRSTSDGKLPEKRLPDAPLGPREAIVEPNLFCRSQRRQSDESYNE